MFAAKAGECAAFSGDGRLLALSLPGWRDIVIRDVGRGADLRRFRLPDRVTVSSLDLSPDGRRLVTGLSDCTLLVWSVPGRKWQSLDAASAAKTWDDLAGEPKKAFAARAALADSPAVALPLLRAKLEPVVAADAAELRRLFTDLDAEAFDVRDKARQKLEQLGDLAAEAIRAELKKKPPLEAARRMEALLRRLAPPITDAELLRSLRAVAALEDIGTQDAHKLVESLAAGAAGARLTLEAKATLSRIRPR